MEHYVGLDISLKLTAICIGDRTGKIQREGVVPSDPEAIAAFIESHFRGRLVGPYGVVAICEALDKAGFEIVPKQEAQPSGLGFLSFCCGCHETRYLKTVTL